MRQALKSTILVVILISSPALAEELTGKIVHILDGDTVKVTFDGGLPVKVRLYGVDCPERNQPWGREARQLTNRLNGQRVLVDIRGRGKYGRWIGVVTDKLSHRVLNLELVRAGLGWWHKKYAPHAHHYRQAEDLARRAKRGLWSDPNPIPPWDWRKGRRSP